MDNDTLHLINDKVEEIMGQLKQNLKKILVQQIYCNNTNKIIVLQGFWSEYLHQKYQSNNTNKIIVLQGFWRGYLRQK